MENKMIINNEFDYSNKIPTLETVSYLIKYMDSVYDTFIKLTEEDEKKNEPLKDEYRNYDYKKSYGTRFEIYIRLKTYNNISCKRYKEYQSAVDDGNMKNILGLEIKLNLDYKSGKARELEEHENSFSIIIKPYEFIFARKSSHNDSIMNQVENNINEILNKFTTINTIFCTKNNEVVNNTINVNSMNEYIEITEKVYISDNMKLDILKPSNVFVKEKNEDYIIIESSAGITEIKDDGTINLFDNTKEIKILKGEQKKVTLPLTDYFDSVIIKY